MTTIMTKDPEDLDEKDEIQTDERQLGEKEGKKSEDKNLDFYLETIENLSKERDENYDLFLRKQAEFQNYRKRVEKEKQELRIAVQAEVIKGLLGILDAFEKGLRTLEKESTDSELHTYREGYELILKEFRSLLEKFGVTEIAGRGASFDPSVHEAVVSEVTTQYKDGEILDEYRKGYKIGNRLLRPSQVKVAVQPDESPVGHKKGQKAGT